MRTHPATRKRYASQPTVTVGGLTRILQGVFGLGSPASGRAMETPTLDPREGAFYTYFEGDLFTPGSSNWVLDPSHETPLSTVWGHAFLRTPNTFNPIQPPQVYNVAMRPTNGVGGVVSGQMVTQPLSENPEF